MEPARLQLTDTHDTIAVGFDPDKKNVVVFNLSEHKKGEDVLTFRKPFANGQLGIAVNAKDLTFHYLILLNTELYQALFNLHDNKATLQAAVDEMLKVCMPSLVKQIKRSHYQTPTGSWAPLS